MPRAARDRLEAVVTVEQRALGQFGDRGGEQIHDPRCAVLVVGSPGRPGAAVEGTP
ncbi:hypothetical protein ACFWPU_08730 [Streptomyces sp. NPDC058471]|uniref:hypothetical protein n=1 Tax=Streptomyces sp. NPDC058471 TaxID=3346516 RepID=UPI00365DA045